MEWPGFPIIYMRNDVQLWFRGGSRVFRLEAAVRAHQDRAALQSEPQG